MWARRELLILSRGPIFNCSSVSPFFVNTLRTFTTTTRSRSPFKKSNKKPKIEIKRPPKKIRELKKAEREQINEDQPYEYAKVLRKEPVKKEKKETESNTPLKHDTQKIRENNRVRKAGVAGETFNKIKWWRVAPSDDGLRLDRFIQLQCPNISFTIANQLMRKGKITVGNRETREKSTVITNKSLKGNRRLLPGEYIHINFDCIPLKTSNLSKAERLRHHISKEQIENIRSMVIYRDKNFMAINKPSGMPVQGDGIDIVSLLPFLQDFPNDCADEIPRLVHRIDKDTSGVLLLARTRPAAVHLGALFRTKGLIIKKYWGLVTNRVRPREGKIRMALKKVVKGGSDYRIGLTEHDDDADMAISQYYTIDFSGRFTLLGLEPITGKTHQLRVHCSSALHAPILGDSKYFATDLDESVKDQLDSITGGYTPLHLHAREVQFIGANKKVITISAPLPPHMVSTFTKLGWNVSELHKTDSRICAERGSTLVFGPSTGLQHSEPTKPLKKKK